ncbi:MAG: right-handed parallel beta-helix repeat-containing protein [Chloroflexi bacterium]|nr:right-handed parallel beta-helix repeat-containing protein [Chloroflexota bacterium]
MRRFFRAMLFPVAIVAMAALISPVLAADIAVDETCSLADAIVAANSDSATGGCRAGSGADTIILSGDISLDAALPPIESDLTIDGRDFEINGEGMFRIFQLTAGDVALRRLSMTDGYSEDDGGAIHAAGALNLNIARSSIVDNRAGRYGGGIFTGDAVTVSISDTTIAGNSAGRVGGGLDVFRGGDLVLTHVTLVNNVAPVAGAISAPRSGQLIIRNSVIAGNEPEDCFPRPDEMIASHIGDGSCYSPLFGDPMLGTFTGRPGYFPPLDGSPVINAAADEHCTDSDQAGRRRPQGESCDVGAIESASAIAPAPTPAPESCTLADQIIAANTDAPAGQCPAGDGPDTITLTEDLTLAAPLPPVTSEITIEGDGHSISGDKRFRIFMLDGGKLRLNRLSLVEGFSKAFGSAVLVHQGDLTLSDCSVERHFNAEFGLIRVARDSTLVISHCSFEDNEGTSIHNSGTAFIDNTSFRHNVAELGGAISNGGDLTIRASEIIENSASLSGSAIAAVGDTTVIDTRISGNVMSSPWPGAVIWHRRGKLSILNSAISDNEADNDEAAIDSSGGELLIENSVISGNNPDAGWGGPQSD